MRRAPFATHRAPATGTAVALLNTLLIALTLLGCPLTASAEETRGFVVGGVSADELSEMSSEARVALVIGNGGYRQGGLTNPKRDARLMAKTLKRLGFEVHAHVDLDQRGLKRAIRDFGDRLQALEGGVGLFYYAGHGAQVDGRNYLVPVDARIERASDIPIDSVDVATVLARMEGARTRMNIVILDACRNNPFRSATRALGDQGLASIDAPRGTLLAYATAPGSVALDGAGANGTYTAALARQMTHPGLEIAYLFRSVRTAVREQTEGAQVPWESSSLEGRFFFQLPTAPAAEVVHRRAPPPKACGEGRARDGEGRCALACGSGAACVELGMRAFDAGRAARSVEAFTRACEVMASPDGCNYLGVRLFKGEGVAADAERAARLFARACAAGSGLGCTNHGHRLFEGVTGRPSDPAAAATAYLAACDLGDAEGCFYAGEARFEGQGLPRDVRRAAELYRRGCEGRHARSCNNLAARYDRGEGVARDVKRAASLYEEACRLGDGVGCNNLAWMHRKGEGVRRDVAAARRWHRRACELGDAQGCEDRGR